MSYDFPARLIDLKRQFLAAEEDVSAIARSLPRAVDIASGAVVLSVEQQRAWDEAWSRLQALGVALQMDEWWGQVPDAVEARAALRAVAQAPL